MSCSNVNSGPSNPVYVAINGTNTDAFGRLRVSEPYSLFDSQNRYAIDNQFDTSTTTGATTSFLVNEASVAMITDTTSGAEAVRQSHRVMLYQPGKGLLVLATFKAATPIANLRQRIGYFSTQNGVYFETSGAGTGTSALKAFVLRTYISGSVDNTTRRVEQSAWNGDKLDGTGPSGLTLDLSYPQILWMDFEWLGVGNVRCGFIINGQYIVCHTYQNANFYGNSVYMTTASLPVRYEITNTGATSGTSTLKQICSSVVSEGGLQPASIDHCAIRSTSLVGVATTLLPLVSITLSTSALGAIVIPSSVKILPTSADSFEIQLVKNATLTGASYSTVASDANVMFDVNATAMTGGTIVQVDYVSGDNQGQTVLNPVSAFNWDYQLGVSLAGVSDVYTIGVRTITGSGDIIGSLTFYDLTQ
jgi:hypothetical protein